MTTPFPLPQGMGSPGKLSQVLPTCVAKLSTCCTNSCVSVGFFRNSFTMAVSSCSWTCGGQTDRQTGHTGFVQEHMDLPQDLTPTCLSRDQRHGDHIRAPHPAPLQPIPTPSDTQVDHDIMGQDLGSRLHSPRGHRPEHPLTSTWISSRNSPVTVPPGLSGSQDRWLGYFAFADFALVTVTWLQGALHSFPEMETLQNSTGNPTGLSCPGRQGRHGSLFSLSSSKGIPGWHCGITR